MFGVFTMQLLQQKERGRPFVERSRLNEITNVSNASHSLDETNIFWQPKSARALLIRSACDILPFMCPFKTLYVKAFQIFVKNQMKFYGAVNHCSSNRVDNTTDSAYP